MTDVPAGVHALRLTKDGFETREIAGVVVDAGLPTVLQEPIRLRRSRGQIKGRIALSGALNSDGVAIQLVSDDGAESYDFDEFGG